MNINEIFATVEELTYRVALLEQTLSALVAEKAQSDV